MEAFSGVSVIKGDTREVKNKLLHHIFEEVAKSSSNIALIFEENNDTRKHTYSELDILSNKVARYICQTVLDNNLKKNADGDFVIAVSVKPSDYLVIILLAIWKAGAAYLPLDPEFPSQRIEHILQEAQPSIVIYDDDSEKYPNSYKLSVNDILTEQNKCSSKTLSSEEQQSSTEQKIGIILYTSGSTGIPKGVRLSHKTILNRLQWQFKSFPYSSTEKTAVFKTALTFVDSVSEIWGPLLNGLALLVISKATTKNPEKLVNPLEKYKIERFVLVPTLLKSLLTYFKLNDNKRFLPCLKTWVCSGETLVASLVNEFYEYFPSNEYRLCNFYGSTEVMGDVTYHVASQFDELNYHGKIPIGVPVDNTIIYLLDNKLQPVKTGEIGELYVSGLNIANGYVNGRDPEKFVKNPLAGNSEHKRLYKTGDFAKVEKETLLYEGRTDSQVKVRGHRVDLSEIEKAVKVIENVDNAVVLCYKPGEIDQQILAFVKTKMHKDKIQTMLKESLISYMLPEVIVVDDIPLLVNGKVDRQLLLKQYENLKEDFKHNQQIDFTGIPEAQLESAKILFQTVASVLDKASRKALCVDANYYEIGGNSSNSILTIAALKDSGYHISIEDFTVSKNFGEILNKMSLTNKVKCKQLEKQYPYIVEFLQDQYKQEVVNMVSKAFFDKSPVEKWIDGKINEEDYIYLFGMVWESLVQANLSFILKTPEGKVVGASFNFDVADEPSIELPSNLSKMLEFLERVDEPIRKNQLPQEKGKIIHSFAMGTHSTLTPSENIIVVNQMENEIINLGKSRNFEGILTTNSNPLTQQLAMHEFSYETLLECTINQYVASDNTRTFERAPDSVKVLVQFKKLT